MRLVALVVGLAALAPAPATRAPARLQVVAHEFSLGLSRQAIVAGPAVIELVNLGMDPHDLRLQRIGGKRVYGIPETAPGTRRELDAKLLPGRYRLWCSIGNHRAMGMRATLRVVTRK